MPNFHQKWKICSDLTAVLSLTSCSRSHSLGRWFLIWILRLYSLWRPWSKILIAKPAINYFQAPLCFSNTSHCHHWNRLQQVMVVLFKSSSSSSDCPSLQLFSCLWWKTATRLSRYLQTSGFKLVAHRYNLSRYAHTLTWRSFTVFHDESLDKEQVWRLWWLWGTKTMMVVKS